MDLYNGDHIIVGKVYSWQKKMWQNGCFEKCIDAFDECDATMFYHILKLLIVWINLPVTTVSSER